MSVLDIRPAEDHADVRSRFLSHRTYMGEIESCGTSRRTAA